MLIHIDTSKKSVNIISVRKERHYIPRAGFRLFTV